MGWERGIVDGYNGAGSSAPIDTPKQRDARGRGQKQVQMHGPGGKAHNRADKLLRKF